MEYTQFGQTALHVSRISYGTWQFGGDWGRVERTQWEAGKASVQKALELGINFFDTAQAYGFGLAERLLGEALQPYLKKGPTFLKVYAIPVLLLNLAVGGWTLVASHLVQGMMVSLGDALIITVGLRLYLVYLDHFLRQCE